MRDELFDMLERGGFVFPLVPKGKTPLFAQNWKLTSTNDPGTVDAWLREHPRMNYGIDLAKSGWFVVDPDVKSEIDGRWAYMALLYSLGLSSPDTLIVNTQSGGSHCYYKAPEVELGNSAGKLGPGIDTRGWGGYVVGPGCRGSQGRYEVYRDRPISELPAPVLELLLPKPLERQQRPLRGDLSPYATSALRRELAVVESLPKGQRNHGLYVASCHLGSLLGAGAFEDREDLHNLIFAAAMKMPEPFETPLEAEITISRGLDWGMAHPRHLVAVPSADLAV